MVPSPAAANRSCAFSLFQVNSTSVTVTGINGAGGTSTATASFVLAPKPLVNKTVNHTTGQQCDYVVNSACSLNVGQTDVLEVDGTGFNPLGGNNVQFMNQVNPNDVTYFFAANPPGGYWIEGSPSTRETTYIKLQLDCSVTPTGAWKIAVRDSSSGTPSDPITINVAQGGGCH